MPRIAANLSFLFTEMPFLDRFAAARDAGFTAVEFLFPYDQPPDTIGARLSRFGLTLALFNSRPGDWNAAERGLATLPDRFGELRAGVVTALCYTGVTGTRRLHLMAGLADPRDPVACAAYHRALAYSSERLAENGRDLLIEPINPRSMPG